MNNINYITSNSNAKIKFIKSLHRKKNRYEEGLFIIEGKKIIEECIEYNYNLELLVLTNSFIENIENENFLKIISGLKLNILYVDDKLFNEISDTETPQGILGISNLVNKKFEIDNVKENDFYLLLDEIQDPGNMGTIIRTADAFGVSGIFITEGSVDIHNSKVVRSTMGSIYRTPIYLIDNFEEFKDNLEKMNLNIYSTSLKGKVNINSLEYKNSMFIIGNESKGVSKKYEALTTDLVKIPMIGKTESLNVAIASSIIMYEAMINRKL